MSMCFENLLALSVYFCVIGVHGDPPITMSEARTWLSPARCWLVELPGMLGQGKRGSKERRGHEGGLGWGGVGRQRQSWCLIWQWRAPQGQWHPHVSYYSDVNSSPLDHLLIRRLQNNRLSCGPSEKTESLLPKSLTCPVSASTKRERKRRV